LLKICINTGHQEKCLHLKKNSWPKRQRVKRQLQHRQPMEALQSVRLPAKFLLRYWREAKQRLPKPAQTKAKLRKLSPVV
jgi:hypothetical protein